MNFLRIVVSRELTNTEKPLQLNLEELKTEMKREIIYKKLEEKIKFF